MDQLILNSVPEPVGIPVTEREQLAAKLSEVCAEVVREQMLGRDIDLTVISGSICLSINDVTELMLLGSPIESFSDQLDRMDEWISIIHRNLSVKDLVLAKSGA